MKRIKDRLYDILVRRNENVRYEYERFVMENLTEHYEHHYRHLKVLVKLNWHYCVKKNKVPLIFFDKVDKEASLTIGGQNQEYANRNEKKNEIYQTNQKINTAKDDGKLENSVELHSVNQGGKHTQIAKVKSVPLNELNLTHIHIGNVYCGSESLNVDLPSPYHFARKLLQYDVISFDIFDTLLFRPFSSPKDLFLLLQSKNGINKFHDIRIRSELEARRRMEILKGTREVTIYDIYEIVSEQTGLDMDEAIRNELDIEKEFCYFNPFMKQVMHILKLCNKQVILVSDMYYPKAMLSELLKSKGISYYSEMFVSCDYKSNKTSGELYEYVLEKYPGKKICHVGDNIKSDIDSAKKCGMSVLYYPNVNLSGNKYRICTRAMCGLIGSAYSGLVNAYLLNGYNKFSKEYEFGFLYGGIYILGYMNWVHEFAKDKKIDKILFLSRDGMIYSRIFNLLFRDIENEYVYWSRVVTVKISALFDKENFIHYFELAKNESPNWLESAFSAVGLEMFYKELDYRQVAVFRNKIEYLKEYIYENWNIIANLLKSDNFLTEKKLNSICKGKKRVAVVDVGWQGSSAYYISKILSSKCQVYSLLCGSLAKDDNYSEILKGNQFVYAFSAGKNRYLYDLFKKNNNKIAAIFELFTQADSPMFKGYKNMEDKIGYEFFSINPSISSDINEIHNGIYDFCKTWKHIYKNYPMMFNISGNDALGPFRVMAEDKYYYPQNLKKYETIKDIV